jgi:hypothetical protein
VSPLAAEANGDARETVTDTTAKPMMRVEQILRGMGTLLFL